jgi:RHS repeat-associated protein
LFYLKDALGSVMAIVDGRGAVVQSYEYSAYGESLSGKDAVNAFRFVGGAGGYTDDATGLVQFWNRWYDPQVGKWVSEDPIRQAGGVNLYGYVGNGPADHVDINGLFLLPVGPIPPTVYPPTQDPYSWHRDRNKNNHPPAQPPVGGGCGDNRTWNQDYKFWAEGKGGPGATGYRGSDGSEAYYDKDGNLLPGVGTYNYAPGPYTNPLEALEHLIKDVLPHYLIGDDYSDKVI